MAITQYQHNGKTINKSDGVLAWKLVHNGTYIIYSGESTAVIRSMDSIEEFPNEASMDARISALGLIDLPIGATGPA